MKVCHVMYCYVCSVYDRYVRPELNRCHVSGFCDPFLTIKFIHSFIGGLATCGFLSGRSRRVDAKKVVLQPRGVTKNLQGTCLRTWLKSAPCYSSFDRFMNEFMLFWQFWYFYTLLLCFMCQSKNESNVLAISFKENWHSSLSSKYWHILLNASSHDIWWSSFLWWITCSGTHSADGTSQTA